MPSRDRTEIRVLIVDDHPSVRAGLYGLLRSEPGFVPVGTSATAEDAVAQVGARAPDVVLADYHLPDRNGLLLGWELKQLREGPRVMIYSAFAEPQLSLAAALSGVDAVLDKSSPVEAIFEMLREVAAGRTLLGPIPAHVMRSGVSLIDPQDQSILGLAVAGEPPDEIAAVLGMDTELVKRRMKSMVEWLRPRPRAEVHEQGPRLRA
jgi:two-component system, NarL family, response regulator DevR